MYDLPVQQFSAGASLGQPYGFSGASTAESGTATVSGMTSFPRVVY
jgi:hypothetical protein